jgi:hypothetical protein
MSWALTYLATDSSPAFNSLPAAACVAMLLERHGALRYSRPPAPSDSVEIFPTGVPNA